MAALVTKIMGQGEWGRQLCVGSRHPILAWVAAAAAEAAPAAPAPAQVAHLCVSQAIAAEHGKNSDEQSWQSGNVMQHQQMACLAAMILHLPCDGAM